MIVTWSIAVCMFFLLLTSKAQKVDPQIDQSVIQKLRGTQLKFIEPY